MFLLPFPLLFFAGYEIKTQLLTTMGTIQVLSHLSLLVFSCLLPQSQYFLLKGHWDYQWKPPNMKCPITETTLSPDLLDIQPSSDDPQRSKHTLSSLSTSLSHSITLTWWPSFWSPLGLAATTLTHWSIRHACPGSVRRCLASGVGVVPTLFGNKFMTICLMGTRANSVQPWEGVVDTFLILFIWSLLIPLSFTGLPLGLRLCTCTFGAELSVSGLSNFHLYLC